jgi:hypothetical protein
VSFGDQNEPTTVAQRTCNTVNIPLTVGNVYEIALFQAERHVTQSNYKLTLKNFVKRRSQCVPVCGDGIQTSNEECDDGSPSADPPHDEEPNNTSSPEYDACTQGTCPGASCCTLGPFCGDSIPNGT